MRSVMTLCGNCRTIQKAGSVCSICGTRVHRPGSTLIVLPPKPRPKGTGTEGDRRRA
jgi:recombinational DNA repair protein RecR